MCIFILRPAIVKDTQSVKGNLSLMKSGSKIEAAKIYMKLFFTVLYLFFVLLHSIKEVVSSLLPVDSLCLELNMQPFLVLCFNIIYTNNANCEHILLCYTSFFIFFNRN